MNPALLGAITAASWGTADFIARYTGRAVGIPVALLGMLVVSGLGLTILAWDDLGTLAWHPRGGPLAIAGGVGITFATLLVYWALARGPVTVAAPICSSYPAFAMLIAVARGAGPSAIQWAASGVVLAGVIVVARFAPEDDGDAHCYGRAHLRKTVWISIAAATGLAGSVLVAQDAATVYGELPNLWIARWVGVACLLLVLICRRSAPRIPVRWWPILALQGLLDSVAFVGLFAAAGQAGAEIAVVVSSGFGAVTVLLARLILKETMNAIQWAGIAAIVGGVAALSWYS